MCDQFKSSETLGKRETAVNWLGDGDAGQHQWTQSRKRVCCGPMLWHGWVPAKPGSSRPLEPLPFVLSRLPANWTGAWMWEALSKQLSLSSLSWVVTHHTGVPFIWSWRCEFIWSSCLLLFMYLELQFYINYAYATPSSEVLFSWVEKMGVIVCIPRTLMLESYLFPRWRSHSYLLLVLFYCVEIVFSFGISGTPFLWFSLGSSPALSLLVHFLPTGIQILEFFRAQSYPSSCSRYTLSLWILILHCTSVITFIQVLYHH